MGFFIETLIGGLMAGIAIAAKALNPAIRLIGVEAAAYPTMACAIAGTEPPRGRPTIAEGIAVKYPGTRTRPIIERHVEEILVLDESQLELGVQELAITGKYVAEGAGAAPLAALLAHPDKFAGRKVALVISGGNIDATLLASTLMRSLVRNKRLVRLRVEVSDAPGGLALATRIIAEAGANVLEVQHNRLFFDVPIKLTEIDFVLEVRDAAHGERLVRTLGSEGITAQVLPTHAHGLEPA